MWLIYYKFFSILILWIIFDLLLKYILYKINENKKAYLCLMIQVLFSIKLRDTTHNEKKKEKMTKRCKKNRCGDRNRLFKWWNSFNEELSCDFNHLLMMRWKMNSTSSWPFCFLFRICSYLVGVEKKSSSDYQT